MLVVVLTLHVTAMLSCYINLALFRIEVLLNSSVINTRFTHFAEVIYFFIFLVIKGILELTCNIC